MGGRYLVVSDLHVSDVEDHADGWKIHKSSRFLIDEDFAALLERFVHRTHGPGARTLVLNGDIFDFDLVTAVPAEPTFPVSPFERERGLDATEEKSAWKLAFILAQHPVFVATLAEFAAAGNRIVYVLGNHDREFHFGAVQQVLLDAMQAHAERVGARLAEGSVRFEPWFFYVEGELYAEHGNQFDHYSSFRDVLSPVVDGREGPAIAVPMGNLSNRLMASRMGYFNPHAADFILNFFRYMRHWLDYYAFTRRSLFWSWLVGSVLVIVRLLEMKKRLILRRRDEAAFAQVARRFSLSVSTLEALRGLHKPPIANRLYRVMHEFWMDRLVLLSLLVFGAVAFMMSPAPLWAKVLLPLMGVPLGYFVYDTAAKGETIFTMEEQLPRSARQIADILPVRLVTFGHTHKPRLIPLREGATFVDTGAWAPITDRNDRSRLASGFRNYLIADFADAEPRITFECWPIGAASANQDHEAPAAAAGERLAAG
jgi:UDP-2,3-diacylglucosamine pyrophosphatase LpxH